MPLRPLDFYRDANIQYVQATATSIDTKARELITSAGKFAYEALLIATGAEPFVPPIEGAESPHVFTVRTLHDAQEIIAKNAKRAVVIGASFIGLETAASLRARGADVSVVGMETVPLERVLGSELGQFVRALHEAQGVRFHLGRKPVSIDREKVVLDDGSELPADVVILGTGVRPRVALAKAAGAKIDDGIVVDGRLRTSLPGVYAAGDVARYPYRGGQVRIEHWVLAERQGQHAARAMLGRDAPFDDVPFFWSAHYDVTIRYVGHATEPDAVELDGSLDARDAIVRFRERGRLAAVATVGRDRAALEARAELAE
jgi:NADPH-dependent 2,4-dienoyl-CoA reductase/sulfur reductase-like enzyme